jgi:hypothetical protein
VLEVVDLRQELRIARLAGQDVAQPGRLGLRLPASPWASSSAQARSTSSGL